MLERTRRIAVLGIKMPSPSSRRTTCPNTRKRAGYEIVPVPVYYPEVTEILGEPVYRTRRAVPGRRRHGERLPPPDATCRRTSTTSSRRGPRSVWFQLGIRNDAAAERLARAGIDVVQDRCLMVELRQRGWTRSHPRG